MQLLHYAFFKEPPKEFPSLLSRNESDWHPWGCRFDPWSRLVGKGSLIAMSCGVGRRCSLDPVLLWLWCRPAATAPSGPLAWELPYTAGGALKRQKKKNPKNLFTFIGWQHTPPCGSKSLWFLDLAEGEVKGGTQQTSHTVSPLRGLCNEWSHWGILSLLPPAQIRLLRKGHGHWLTLRLSPCSKLLCCFKSKFFPRS